jgi:hypothetical protein
VIVMPYLGLSTYESLNAISPGGLKSAVVVWLIKRAEIEISITAWKFRPEIDVKEMARNCLA